MKINRTILFLTVILFAFSIGGCGNKKDAFKIDSAGGVFSSSDKDLDLDPEISGRLSEDVNQVVEAFNPDELNQQYNKIMSWGIARKPDNQLPAADPGTPELLKKYGGLYLGDTSKKVVYLTFDEGYENGYTSKILDVLRDNNAKAVFFITGPYLKEHEGLVRRMVEEGHEVGNHTIHHPSLPSLSDNAIQEEITGLDRAFSEKFGRNMSYLRPPKGEYSPRTLDITQKLGYCNLFWSFAYDDWYRDKIRGADYAYNIVMRNLHNGAVLLLHAVSKDNADALDSIIKGVRERGYEIGDIRDLKKSEAADQNGKPGKGKSSKNKNSK